MKARSGIPVGMVPIRDENGDVRLISFEEYRQWWRTDPSEKGLHPINNPKWTVQKQTPESSSSKDDGPLSAPPRQAVENEESNRLVLTYCHSIRI